MQSNIYTVILDIVKKSDPGGFEKERFGTGINREFYVFRDSFIYMIYIHTHKTQSYGKANGKHKKRREKIVTYCINVYNKY